MKKVLLHSALLSSALLNGQSNPKFTLHSHDEYKSNIVYIFAHGLGATQQQGMQFSLLKKNTATDSFNPTWIIGCPTLLFNFPDAKNDNNEYFNKQVNLGQQLDIDRLCAAHAHAKNELPEHEVVLVGLSRGSVTIINYLATHTPQDVRAVILESPFDTFKNVVKHLLRRFYMHWIPFASKIGMKLSGVHFPMLDKKGIFPLDVIKKTPHDIPVLFVHSKKDKVIPINSSRTLYAQLKAAGHEHAYLLELPSGSHGKLLMSEHAQLYHCVVQAFYKRYDLPHDPKSAQKGEATLSQCQPSCEQVLQRIKKG